MNIKYLGALKDPVDKRDFLIKDYLAKDVILPNSLDISKRMLPVRDQGAEGSCTAFSGCAIKEGQEENEGHLSTRYLYEKVKQPSGGAFPRDIMNILLTIGVPPESCQPYTPNVVTPACPNADELAKPNKIQGYARLNTLDEMKLYLYQYGSFMIATSVTKNWFNVGADGIIMEGGDIVGYHAIAFVGYDDENQLIKFKNSWSAGWGDKGYGYLSYSHFMRILSDAWGCVDIPEDQEEGNPPKPEPAPVPPEPQPEPEPVEPSFMDKYWIPLIIIVMMIITVVLRLLAGG
jgi:C1A family cysteine protease